MKKITLILSFIFIALISLTVETQAQNCPDGPEGFYGPYTSTFAYGNCFIRVVWCCKWPDGGSNVGNELPSIAFDSVIFVPNDPHNPDLSCFNTLMGTDIYGQQVITILWSMLIEDVINEGKSNGCFNPEFFRSQNIFHCPDMSKKGQLRVYNGWCYSFTPPHIDQEFH